MSAPTIIAPKLKQPGQVGQQMKLTVEIKGDPLTTIKWQVGRKKVKESSKYHLIYNPERGEYGLEVMKVTEEMREGVWVVASNNFGEDCCCIDVDVDDDQEVVRRDNGPVKKASSLKQPYPTKITNSQDQRDDNNNCVKHNSLKINDSQKESNGSDKNDIDGEANRNMNNMTRKSSKAKSGKILKTKSASMNRIKNGSPVRHDNNTSGTLEINLKNEIDKNKFSINENKNIENNDKPIKMGKIKNENVDEGNNDTKRNKSTSFDYNNEDKEEEFNEENKDEKENNTNEHVSDVESEEIEDNEMWFLYGQNIIGLCKDYLKNSNFEGKNETDHEDELSAKNNVEQENLSNDNNQNDSEEDVEFNRKINDTNGYKNKLPDGFYKGYKNKVEERNVETTFVQKKDGKKIEENKSDEESEDEINVEIRDAKPLNKPQNEKETINNQDEIQDNKIQLSKDRSKNDDIKTSKHNDFDYKHPHKNQDAIITTIPCQIDQPFTNYKLQTYSTQNSNKLNSNVVYNGSKLSSNTKTTKQITTDNTPPKPITKETSFSKQTTTESSSPKPTTTQAPISQLDQEPPLVSKPPHSSEHRGNNKAGTLTTYIASKKYNHPQNTIRKQKQMDRKRCMSADPFKDRSEDDEEEEEMERGRSNQRERLRSESTLGRPHSSASQRRSRLIPARSEEILVIRRSSSRRLNRILNESSDIGSLSDLYKSLQSLDRSEDGESFNLGKRTLSREWKVVTVTTTEETYIVDEDKSKNTKTTETSTEDLLGAFNKEKAENKVLVGDQKKNVEKVGLDKNVGPIKTDKNTGTQTIQKPSVELKKPKSYSFGQQTDLKVNDKTKIQNNSKNETTQTSQTTKKETYSGIVVPVVIKPNNIPTISLTHVKEPQQEYMSYEYGEMIRFYSTDSEEGRQILNYRKDNKRGFGKKKNIDSKYGNKNESNQYSNNPQSSKSPTNGQYSRKNKDDNKPHGSSTNTSFTSKTESSNTPSIPKMSKTQNNISSESTKTSTTSTTSPSKPPYHSSTVKPNFPNMVAQNEYPYSSYTSETHNTQLSYMLNNFILKPQKNVNFHVQQNVNNITINIDGDDDPEKVIELIKDNFPGSNNININYIDNGNLIDFTTDEEANDTPDYPIKLIGRAELKPSLRYNQNTFAPNNYTSNKKSINISRLGPGKYSLEYIEEANDAINFANLLELSKDKKSLKDSHTSDLNNGTTDKFKTNLNDPKNKFKTTSSSKVDRIAGSISADVVRDVLSEEQESSIDRYVEIIHKDNQELKVGAGEASKIEIQNDNNWLEERSGTSVVQRNGHTRLSGSHVQPACMLESRPSMRESLELLMEFVGLLIILGTLIEMVLLITVLYHEKA